MAIQIIKNNDSIYDYGFEDGYLYGRRKNSKGSFRIDSEKAYDVLLPQIKALGIDPHKPTSQLVYIPEHNFTPHPPATMVQQKKNSEEKESLQKKYSLSLIFQVMEYLER